MNIKALHNGRYEICDNGIIYSNIKLRKELKLRIDKYGYKQVIMVANGKRINKRLHRIVAESFIENPNGLPEVNHIDGDKLNNSAGNLEWCTARENRMHARDNKLQEYKIDMDIANEIRRQYQTGKYSYSKLSKMFQVSKTHIGSIITNKRWCI